MWTDNADHDRDRDDGHSCHDYVGLAQARPNYIFIILYYDGYTVRQDIFVDARLLVLCRSRVAANFQLFVYSVC